MSRFLFAFQAWVSLRLPGLGVPSVSRRCPVGVPWCPVVSRGVPCYVSRGVPCYAMLDLTIDPTVDLSIDLTVDLTIDLTIDLTSISLSMSLSMSLV